MSFCSKKKAKHREDNKSSDLPKTLIPGAKYEPELPHLTTQGYYKQRKPEGIIVHFTAGRQNQSARSALTFALKQSHTYLFIDGIGDLYQQFELNRWGYHAGASLCPITHRAYVSRYYIGIEVASAGRLEERDGKYYTWWGDLVKDPRIMKNTLDNIKRGPYQAFTPAQESKLLATCVYLCKEYGIKHTMVFGHDEVAPDRKNDPGGALSKTMPEFRESIKLRLQQ